MLRMLNRFRPTTSRGKARRASRPALEGLEDRKLLYATLGGSWAYGSRITYSFAPDGTSVGGVASNMFSTLNAVTPTANWQQAIQKAAALWSSYANINLALVPDSGAQFGVSGNQQGDARFGDIRFAMIPQGTGALAFSTLPPPFNGGTNAGDVVFNSNIYWRVNSDYDVETVALHEMGHALGLDHSAISTAVMYAYYHGIKQSLGTDDQSGIQSVYGAYPADTTPNISFATAQDLTGLITPNGQIALANQSLSGTADVDYFVVTVPANTNGTMVVSMQSTNLSSVSPRVTLYNGAKVGLGQTSLPNSFGATATYTVNGVSPGQVYYVRASAASGLGSYGAFGLLVNFGSDAQPAIAPPNTVVAEQYDQGGGSLTLEGDVSKIITLIRTEWKAASSLIDSSLNRNDLNIIQVGDFKAYGEIMKVESMPKSRWVNRPDADGSSVPPSSGKSWGRSQFFAAANVVDPLIGSTAVAPWPEARQHSTIDDALAQLDDDAFPELTGGRVFDGAAPRRRFLELV